MANRARSRGEKEPTGKTKSAILLYLADNGESTFTDIRTRLADECNIKSSKDVRIHLEDLASDDRLALVRKISHGSGNANSYCIREGFTGLKRLHNYLNKHGFVHDLMRTRHFRDYTASADFMIKVRTNLSRNTILALYDSIMDDKKYPGLLSLFEGIADEDRMKLVRWIEGIRSDDRDDPNAGSFFIMLDTIRSEDIDRLGEIFMDFLRLGGIMGSATKMDEMRMLMFEFDLPQPRRDAFFTILRLSPAAFDYMLNSTSSNPLFLPNPYTAFIMSQAISRLRTGRDVLPDEGLSRWAGYSAGLRRSSVEAPIFLIARSLFVSDMVYGRLVGDVPEEMLKEVFSI